jgi:hypothetical protein
MKCGPNSGRIEETKSRVPQKKQKEKKVEYTCEYYYSDPSK